jgi:RNA polymerase sigma-70 factor (ECF subfamily)
VKDPDNNLGEAGHSGEPGSTSLSLLAGLRARDAEAWQRLVYLYGPLVERWCRRRGLQPRNCEDVVQQVFLTVAAKVSEFRREQKGDTFRGWLWTITRHKI